MSNRRKTERALALYSAVKLCSGEKLNFPILRNLVIALPSFYSETMEPRANFHSFIEGNGIGKSEDRVSRFPSFFSSSLLRVCSESGLSKDVHNDEEQAKVETSRWTFGLGLSLSGRSLISERHKFALLILTLVGFAKSRKSLSLNPRLGATFSQSKSLPRTTKTKTTTTMRFNFASGRLLFPVPSRPVTGYWIRASVNTSS